MLNGKVVLITGANGGLGSAVTQAFLDAGANVAGVSRDIKNSDFANPNFEAIAASIAKSDDAAAIVGKVRARFGRLDSLIHLVGGFTGGPQVQETAATDFDKMIEINFKAFVYMAQAVLPGMLAQGSGSIVAIGARPAVRPVAGLGAYAASKAALVALVETIAVENRHAGITANVVLPGTMDTPTNRKAMPDVDPKKWVQPAQIAAMLVHLASDAAAQVTGALIPIYGGRIVALHATYSLRRNRPEMFRGHHEPEQATCTNLLSRVCCLPPRGAAWPPSYWVSPRSRKPIPKSARAVTLRPSRGVCLTSWKSIAASPRATWNKFPKWGPAWWLRTIPLDCWRPWRSLRSCVKFAPTRA
ncbi:MAG: SDR family NAD(P)-dependent oxidoreductase [Acidobacteriota bacterium]